MTVLIDGQRITFQPQQWDIFCVLYSARGRRLSRMQIYESVFGGNPDGGPFDAIVRTQISRIRTKLKGTRFTIRNGRTVGGYALERITK